jgi:phosphoesterase RecJ-like protein
MDDHLRTRQLQAVAQALLAGDRYLLAGHVDPDPDCVGSILALDWALRRLGKQSIPVTPDPPLPSWDFFPERERLRLPDQVRRDEWDILVVIDCETGRTGPVAAWAPTASLLINIDHHITNPGTAPVQLLDTEAAASGEIVYDLLAALGVEVGSEAATLLYAAIMADTGSFRFANTTARVLRVAADLVQRGAKPDEIAREIYETHSWEFVQALRQVLGTLARSADGRIAWITLEADVMAHAGVRKNEFEGLIQYPRMIAGVEVALVFREMGPDEVRVGLRSKQFCDVSRLARECGGGGHIRAAGCTIQAPLEEARSRVLRRVQEALAAAEPAGRR